MKRRGFLGVFGKGAVAAGAGVAGVAGAKEVEKLLATAQDDIPTLWVDDILGDFPARPMYVQRWIAVDDACLGSRTLDERWQRALEEGWRPRLIEDGLQVRCRELLLMERPAVKDTQRRDAMRAGKLPRGYRGYTAHRFDESESWFFKGG